MGESSADTVPCTNMAERCGARRCNFSRSGQRRRHPAHVRKHGESSLGANHANALSAPQQTATIRRGDNPEFFGTVDRDAHPELAAIVETHLRNNQPQVGQWRVQGLLQTLQLRTSGLDTGECDEQPKNVVGALQWAVRPTHSREVSGRSYKHLVEQAAQSHGTKYLKNPEDSQVT
jgi:hypothetical protein